MRIARPEARAQPRAGRRGRGAEDQGDGAGPRVRRRGVDEGEGQLGNDRGADQQVLEEHGAGGAPGNDPIGGGEQVLNGDEVPIVIDPLFDMGVVSFRPDMFAKFEESRGGLIAIILARTLPNTRSGGGCQFWLAVLTQSLALVKSNMTFPSTELLSSTDALGEE